MSIQLSKDFINDFLNKGNDIDELIEKRPLSYHCIEKEEVSLLSILLTHGCNTRGLLHLAIWYNSTKSFIYLLDEKVDPNEPNSDNESPISYAVRCRKPFFVQELLERGADPSLQDGNNTMPLIYAIQNQDIDCIRLLLQYHAPTSGFSFETSPLYTAMLTRNIDIVFLLLHYGACPVTGDDSDYSFLSEAIRMDSPEMFRILLTCGATQKNITAENIPEKFRQIFESIAVEPNTTAVSSLDLEKTVTSLTDDFTQISTKIQNVCSKVESQNIREQALTPIINNQNAMIATFTRIVKRIDSASKVLYAKRIPIISSQIGSFAAEERSALESIFTPDEKMWEELINATAPNMMTGAQSFDDETKARIENLKSVFTRKKTDVFKANKIVDAEALKNTRAQLAFQNTMLVKLNKIVRAALQTFQCLKHGITYNLSTALKTLAEFQETLAAIRQTTMDIAVPEEDALEENETNADIYCAVQEGKMQLDSAYLTWLQTQFDEYSQIAEQCLRMCLQ